MTLADARRWAHAAERDSDLTRSLARKLREADTESRARACAHELELAAEQLLRAARFALAALPNDRTKEGAC